MKESLDFFVDNFTYDVLDVSTIKKSTDTFNQVITFLENIKDTDTFDSAELEKVIALLFRVGAYFLYVKHDSLQAIKNLEKTINLFNKTESLKPCNNYFKLIVAEAQAHLAFAHYHIIKGMDDNFIQIDTMANELEKQFALCYEIQHERSIITITLLLVVNGYLLLLKKDTQKAKIKFDTALRIAHEDFSKKFPMMFDPLTASLEQALGLTYFLDNRLDEAELFFQNAIEKKRTDLWQVSLFHRCVLCVAYGYIV